MAVISAVLTVLLAADATYMSVSGYGSDATNNFHLSDAATAFVAAGILLLVTAALLLVRSRAPTAAPARWPTSSFETSGSVTQVPPSRRSTGWT